MKVLRSIVLHMVRSKKFSSWLITTLILFLLLVVLLAAKSQVGLHDWILSIPVIGIVFSSIFYTWRQAGADRLVNLAQAVLGNVDIQTLTKESLEKAKEVLGEVKGGGNSLPPPDPDVGG